MCDILVPVRSREIEMQKRADLPVGAYFLRVDDIDNPKGAQEYYVGNQGKVEFFRHDVLGGFSGYVDIPESTLVIRIRP